MASGAEPEVARPAREAALRLAKGLALVLGGGLAGAAGDLDPRRLLDPEGARHGLELLSGLLSPATDTETLARIGRLAVETLLIGVTGLGLSLLLGIPLALAAARLPRSDEAVGGGPRLPRLRALVRSAARLLLGLLRGVPDILWAFLLVRLLGLGPGPAVLAIGLSFAGIVGKLYAELLEAVDPRPVLALRAAGVGSAGALLFGALPQVRGAWVGYGLVRFECALRSASILGLVGAGGLGAEIELSIRYLQYDLLATALVAVVIIVLSFEALSVFLRRISPWWSIGLVVAGSVAGGLGLAIPWGELLSSDAWAAAHRLFSGGLELGAAASLLPEALAALGQTLLMAAWATALASVVALLAVPWVSRNLGASLVLQVPVRLVLQLARSLPDLVWALIFVLWVGPGPLAGALAIAVHTTGLLGRLFAECCEEAEPAPVQALVAQGARPLGVFGWAALPLVAPRLAAFALFRFEVNVRATAVVGFVGGGGIGDPLHTAISLFHGADLVVLLAVLILAVVVLDALGARVRNRWLAA